MKTEKTKTGWREIKTVNINIKKFASRPLCTIEQWLNANKKYGLRNREKCKCCKRKWTELNGFDYFKHILIRLPDVQ